MNVAKNSVLRCYYLIVILFTNIVFLVYYTHVSNETTTIDISDDTSITNKKYLIDTPGCTIEKLDVFSEEIKNLFYKVNPISCSDKQPITYLVREGDKVSLNINKNILNRYSYFDIQCCYVTIKRNPIGPQPDDNLVTSECIQFEDKVYIKVELIKVKCTNFFSTVYENVHAAMKPPEEVVNKNDPNVILIGIDGVSSSNLIRTMPKTYQYLKNTGWITLKGYNKVEDNTFPNLIAVLAGTEFSYSGSGPSDYCIPYNTNSLEACQFIWKMFKSVNYSTAYAEDTPKIGTFNNNKAGFLTAPTDYYFRPYFLTAEELSLKYLCLKPYCTGPEKTGNRMQDLISGFLDTIKGKTPGFGMFWMNTFSHEDVNCPSSMDEDFEQFFKDLKYKGHLENSIIVFFSDHGFRFGKIRLTPTGWMEERLPYNYIWIPEKFREMYPEEFNNFQENAEKLTTPYDLYMTMQHIIALKNENYIEQQAKGCPKCQSLFKKIDPLRTCKEAGISDHYCTCSNYETINKNTVISKKVATFFVDELNKIINSFGSKSKDCAYYTLEKISRIKKLIIRQGKEENYLVNIVTNPEANFEATVKVTYDNKEMVLNQVNRLDRYAPHSYCAKGDAQMYCYCKSMIKKLTNIFCNNKYCFL